MYSRCSIGAGKFCPRPAKSNHEIALGICVLHRILLYITLLTNVFLLSMFSSFTVSPAQEDGNRLNWEQISFVRGPLFLIISLSDKFIIVYRSFSPTLCAIIDNLQPAMGFSQMSSRYWISTIIIKDTYLTG